jgi:poly-gamma-glutamate synthesis protein (capsule biosynthesis protein)
MERMHKAIEEAAKAADYVVVCFHSHEIKGALDEEPDYFIEEFAHACIEWGATAVAGSGTHQIKAVELYKGKPIFYSIANFISKRKSGAPPRGLL